MRLTARVIARPESSPAFLLAGLQPVTARDADEAGAVVRAETAGGTAGVLLIEDRLYDALPVESRRTLARRALPMVVPFPGPDVAGRPGPDAYIVELLREIVGYRVRLL